MSWPYAYTLYIWPMLGSAVISVVLAVYGWKHRSAPGAAAFAVLMLCNALWAVFMGIEVAATTESAKVLWFEAEAMAAVTAMTALLISAIGYAYPGRLAARRIQWALAAFILVVLLGIPTNDLHHLYWTRIWFDGFVRFERGPLNPPLLVYMLLLPALASLLFLRLALRSRGIYRGQALLLFAGSMLPPLTSLLRAAAINPVAPLDPLILIMNVSGLFYLLAISRFGMLSVVPLARDSVIERMADGLLVLDPEDRVLDMNPAVCRALGLLPGKSVGRPIWQALAAYPQLTRLIQQQTDAESEITLDDPAPRCLRVNIATLTRAHGFKLGRRILFQDVTEQKQARELALEQQRALAALQEREHLARELHDSLGQVFAFMNIRGQTVRRLLARGDIATADGFVADMVTAAQEANTDIRESILGLRVSLSTQGLYPALSQYIKRYETSYGLRTELVWPDTLGDRAFEPAVEAQLLRILQEALTNARKHANAHQVRVVFSHQESGVCVSVQDDGQGFDPAKLPEGVGQGFGLRFMRERAAEVGASVTVHSEPGHGTEVLVQVPPKEEAKVGGEPTHADAARDS